MKQLYINQPKFAERLLEGLDEIDLLHSLLLH